ncbi:MAG TPA: BatD family protein [Flavobacterium sp.]|jgi:hypothetical protein
MKKSLLLLLLCFQGAYAQVVFEARVSKQTLAIDETLQVDFVMNGDGDNFVPPSFEGFRVVAGQRQWMNSMIRNGRATLYKGYSYNLTPLRQGILNIQPATVEINGQIYRSNSVPIRVTPAIHRKTDPQSLAEDEIHLVAEISKTNPFVNEPITIVYKLYCGYDIGITGWKDLEMPKYNDFWSQKIDAPQKVLEGNYNGKRYQYVVVKRDVLYPQKTGRLKIEPYSLDVTVALPTNRRNIFGQMQVIQDNRKISAGTKTIDVKPLPETGKPDEFSGAVGKFKFEVTPSRTTVRYGESLDLAVSVSGTGNLKLFDLPKPVVPVDIEMYDPVRKDRISTPLSGMNGKITDVYTLVPGSERNYSIKPLSFTYFDPSSGRYEKITSDEVTIRVLDGAGFADQHLAGESVDKQPVQASDQFRFIKLKSRLVPMSRQDFFGSPLFYGLVALPLLAIPALVLLRRRKTAADRDVAATKSKNSESLARKYLVEAYKNRSNKELFYIALEKALHNFLKAKLNIETSEMSKENIRQLLLARNAQAEAVDDFLQLTENCEFARYSPSSTGAIQHDYDKAVHVISALEKQL